MTKIQGNFKSKLFLEKLGIDNKREFTGGTDICKCPKCDYETPHRRGIPCNTIICPKCGVKLTGKGTIGEIK